MKSEEKLGAIVASLVALVIIAVIVNVGLSNYREYKLSEKALSNGYVQKWETGTKLWVKP